MDYSSVNEDGALLPILMSSSEGLIPYKRILALLCISAAAVLIHGYHLGTDDGAIYVPAIKSAADPSLYPFGSEFFMTHAHLSFFPDIVGGSARVTGLTVDLVIFLWHCAGVFLLLLAAWRLSAICFTESPARWGSVALLAGFLSIPVAGTALVIMDPYLTARSLSTPATLFAVVCALSRRRREMCAWIGVTALVHPQMCVYAAAFLACLAMVQARSAWFAAGLPFLYPLRAAQGIERQTLYSRTYFFLTNWTWYEWAGVLAPLMLLWLASATVLKGTLPAFRIVARALIVFGVLFTLAGLVVGMPGWLENYARVQPMRAFHLIYVVLFILLGGLLQQHFLKQSTWRWLALFIPISGGMWLLQHNDYPASAHVEWPGAVSSNPWTTAFLWVRKNTPKDAVFAMDPNYMHSPDEDLHGFRAVAERSVLADALKDSGAVSVFPQLARHWREQTEAEAGWTHFKLSDYRKLAMRFPVTWILTATPSPAGLVCPYVNRDVSVCELFPSARVLAHSRQIGTALLR